MEFSLPAQMVSFFSTTNVYELFGMLFVFLIVSAIVATFIGVALILINSVRDKFFLPRLTIFLFTSLRYPIKRILHLLKIRGSTIDKVNIDIRNALQKPIFAGTPVDGRMIFVPQCLRHLKCPAKTSPEFGIMCVKCGKCVIGEIKEHAEKLGYMGCFVVPGSSFIKRIVKRDRPKGIIGVACSSDAIAGMEMVEAYGLPAQSIYLAKAGCVNTVVKKELVIDTMNLGISEDAS